MNDASHASDPRRQAREWVAVGRDIVLRQWKFAAMVAGGVLGLVVLGLVLCPRRYESEAKFFVRVGRESIGLDPTATTGQTLSVHESRKGEMRSVLDVLGSRVVLEGVVDELGAANVLGTAASGAETTPAERERAVRHLADAIDVEHEKESSVVTVTCRSKTPEHARELLTAFLDAFRERHVAMNQTDGSLEFFKSQTELLQAEYEAAAAKLHEAKNDIDAVSIDGRRDAVQQQIATLELEILQSESALAASRARSAALERMLAQLPERTLGQQTTGQPGSAHGETRKRLHELEIREQELLSRYTERHPQVVRVQGQIERARAILQRPSTAEASTRETNPTYQKLEVGRLEEQSIADGHVERLAMLRRQHDRLRGRLRELHDRESKVVRLQQQADLLAAKHGEYSERMEQARIDQALATDMITNVNVVQPPSFVPKPASPRKALVLVLGAIFAAFVALGAAAVRELLFDPSAAPAHPAAVSPVPPSTADRSQRIHHAGRLQPVGLAD